LAEIANLLERLEFKVEVIGGSLHAQAPDHRLDIGQGATGVADLMEEIARIYGYERIPETRLADELPPQRSNPSLEHEERVRDLLVDMGLQEVNTYRLTSPEREARLLPTGAPRDDRPYVTLANPIAADRVVMRHSLLASVMEVVERNARTQPRLALFEIGPVYLASEEGILPDEPLRLVIALSGPRQLPSWQPGDAGTMDFFDLKGVVQALCDDLHIPGARYEPGEHPAFHPGKCARLWIGERQAGVLGELHPLARHNYDLTDAPLLAADLDLQAIISAIPARYEVASVSPFPPVLEDLAVIVDEDLPAERVEAVIRQGGGRTLAELQLFDVYRGEQIGAGKKSLAYNLTYQSSERTLTDDDVLKVRQRIVRQLEKELSARLRS
jgi:phenylalanyl-tRNA synthetase beta chain